jgi:transposase
VKALRGRIRSPKTDKIDAQWLAYLLAKSMLPECWLAPTEVQELREATRFRRSLVNERTQHFQRLHAICQQAGIGTEHAHVSSRTARVWIMALPLLPEMKRVIEARLRIIDAIDHEIEQAESAIRQRWGSDARVEALQPLVDIGIVIACELVAKIGDALRFTTPKQLVRYARLDPTVSESGDSRGRG